MNVAYDFIIFHFLFVILNLAINFFHIPLLFKS